MFFLTAVYASPPKDPCGTDLTPKDSIELPKIKPIALRKRTEPFDDPRYLFELKYDGFRGVMYFEKDRRCTLISRQGNKLAQFQPLCDAIAAELGIQNAIFDGEIIAYDETDRPIFMNMRKRIGPFRYIAFDLLWLNDIDLRQLPLEERREQLLKVLPKKSKLIQGPLAEKEDGSRLFQLIVDFDLEGIVAKPLSSRYTKTAKWYKIKNLSYSQAAGRGRFF